MVVTIIIIIIKSKRVIEKLESHILRVNRTRSKPRQGDRLTENEDKEAYLTKVVNRPTEER